MRMETVDMETFWSLSIESVITAALLVATLAVYLYQYRVMRQQLRVAKATSQMENLLAAIGLLQEEEARTARWWVMQNLSGKEQEDWEEKDFFYASRACSRFDLIGVLAKLGVLPGEIIIENWAPSISRVHAVTKRFREDMKRKNGSQYWANFDWLAQQVIRDWKDPGSREDVAIPEFDEKQKGSWSS